jgi:hypothetical protein
LCLPRKKTDQGRPQTRAEKLTRMFYTKGQKRERTVFLINATVPFIYINIKGKPGNVK